MPYFVQAQMKRWSTWIEKGRKRCVEFRRRPLYGGTTRAQQLVPKAEDYIVAQGNVSTSSSLQ
jgi:hypothetical protein